MVFCPDKILQWRWKGIKFYPIADNSFNSFSFLFCFVLNHWIEISQGFPRCTQTIINGFVKQQSQQKHAFGGLCFVACCWLVMTIGPNKRHLRHGSWQPQHHNTAQWGDQPRWWCSVTAVHLRSTPDDHHVSSLQISHSFCSLEEKRKVKMITHSGKETRALINDEAACLSKASPTFSWATSQVLDRQRSQHAQAIEKLSKHM